jgi:NTP pyrophosphohydrolases including oxidative damage repair enzymes
MSLKRCTGCAASRGKDFSLPDCMEVERSIVAKMNGVVKRLKRELQCEGAITKYYKDTVELPDGKTAVWDFVGHNGAAAAVAVLEDGRLLMVRQYRNALDRYTLEIPAGGLNPNEPTIDAAARELEEEAGYVCGKIERLITIRTTVAFCNEKIDIYLATDLKKTKQHLDEDEYVEVVPYELSVLEDMIYSGEIEDSKTIAAILAYKNKYLNLCE